MAAVEAPRATKRARLTEDCARQVAVELSGGAAYPTELIALWRESADNFCDIVIVVEGKAFPAHRCVLAAASPFMRVHFKQQSFADSGTREFTVSDLSAVAFACALDFIYSGAATLESDARLLDLLEVASRLEVAPLLEAVSAAIQHRVTCTDSVQVWELAERYSLPMLETAARRTCLRSFEPLVKSPSFLSLSRERLLALLGDDALTIDSELTAFEAALQWARHHGATSDSELAELLAHVRFGFMPRERLHDVLSEPLVAASPTIMKDVAYALADKLDVKPEMPRSRPREGCRAIYLLGFEDENLDFSFRLCKRFDPVTRAVTSIASLPGADCPVSATALDGKLYVVAFDGKMERNVMMRYDEATDEWRTLAALATYHGGQRRIASAAALDGKIYVAGGWDTDSDCGRAAVESYDPTSDTWHPVAPMNVARKDFCLVAAQGCLFAIGGETNESWSSDSVEKYDSKTNVWTPVCDMPRGCTPQPSRSSLSHTGFVKGTHTRGYTHMAAAVVVDSDKGTAIVTLGGRSRDEDDSIATNECNAYYPAIDKWDDKWDEASTIRLPKAAEGIGAAMVGGVLWCFGGSDGESATGEITCTTPKIDVQDKKLVFWNPISVGRHSYGFSTITAPKHLEMPPSSFITCVAI